MAMQWPAVGEACCATSWRVSTRRNEWAHVCLMAVDRSAMARERITDGVDGVARLHELIASWRRSRRR